ncbi:hypothetical protein [Ensifer aridi]|nr:hypothetical protein [Ensifer aridi]
MLQVLMYGQAHDKQHGEDHSGAGLVAAPHCDEAASVDPER